MIEKKTALPLHLRITKNKLFFPLLVFIIILILFIFNSRFSERWPFIESITPTVGLPGSVLIVKGKHFGNTRQGSEVVIAGSRLTSSSYIKWSDEFISVRVPEDVGSGMLYVITRNGKSKKVLFTNKNHIPIVISGPLKPGFPYIGSISPTSGSIGTLITIKGLNFGFNKGDGKVYFASLNTSREIQVSEESGLINLIPCSEFDFDYDRWTDQEIHIYVPDGASSGNVKVLTDRGFSNAEYYEVKDQAGTKLFKEKAGYQIHYSVEINIIESNPVNNIDIWVPGIYQELEQSNIENIREPEPLWDNYKGVMRYRFENLEPLTKLIISQTFWFDRFSVETRIPSSRVSKTYDKSRKLYKEYTIPDSLIPSADSRIVNASKEAVRREKNPYLAAKNIYNYLLRRLDFKDGLSRTEILSNYEAGKADSYTYAVLFCALARSAEIPSRPVAGFIVYNDKESSNHYWAEFYIDNLGWIPVDLCLGDGAQFGNFPGTIIQKPEVYYFGNLDNQHITFSRGIIKIKDINPLGKKVKNDNIYSLQTLSEETEGIISYNSLWHDLRVIDWW